VGASWKQEKRLTDLSEVFQMSLKEADFGVDDHVRRPHKVPKEDRGLHRLEATACQPYSTSSIDIF
jgi:hypothetical protein